MNRGLRREIRFVESATLMSVSSFLGLARMALPGFAPGLFLGPVGYEKARAKSILAVSAYASRLAPYIDAYRQQYFDTLSPVYERRHLVQVWKSVNPRVDEQIEMLAVRLAEGAGSPSDVSSICEHSDLAAEQVAWMLMRLCASRGDLRALAMENIQARLVPKDRALVSLDDSLLRADWIQASDDALAAAGHVDGDLRASMVEFSGLARLRERAHESDYDILRRLEFGGDRLDGVTAYCVGHDLLMSDGAVEESVAWLSSVRRRKFRQVDADTRSFLSVVASLFAGALSEPPSVTCDDVRDALCHHSSPLLWHSLTRLWVGLALEEGRLEWAVEEIDRLARQVLPTWEQHQRALEGFSLALLFLEQGALEQAKAWVEHCANEIEDRAALQSQIEQLDHLMSGRAEESVWIQFSMNLQERLGLRRLRPEGEAGDGDADPG
jgi:hypothetical protein